MEISEVKNGIITGIIIKNYNKNFRKSIIENKVRFIDLENYNFYTSKVMDEINFYCRLYSKKDKKFKKTFETKLINFGFDIDILKREILTLSITEQKKIYLLLNLCFDFDCVILLNIFNNIDKYNYNIYISELENLKTLKKKIILIDDINILYNITDEIIIIKNKKIIKKGNTKEVLENVEFLINNDIEIPFLSKFTYLAKTKKNIKLFYQNDVRDVIKDVYKHVK